jgi:tetratricopeptide (TPR) repeat protein
MTAPAAVRRAEQAPVRTTELVLAHAHLRLGALALARVELETMAGLGMLDAPGLIDLAEVRWRTGDLAGAGEAAGAALRTGAEVPVALLIAAEAAASLGRPSEARRLAQRAMACATGSIDAIFAGMPRSSAWPGDADEPPPTAPTLFDRGPEPLAVTDGIEAALPTPTTHDVVVTPPAPSGPVTRGFWDDDEAAEPALLEMPDPALELEAGRAAFVAGSFDQAALRFGLALRLAPALAPAILEATAGARGPALAIVRGDAYRLAGHEPEARQAYAIASQGGAPERRRRSRTREANPKVRSDASQAETETAEALDDPEAVMDLLPAADVAISTEGTPEIEATPEAVLAPAHDEAPTADPGTDTEVEAPPDPEEPARPDA